MATIYNTFLVSNTHDYSTQCVTVISSFYVVHTNGGVPQSYGPLRFTQTVFFWPK
jgi:hypothetical protein